MVANALPTRLDPASWILVGNLRGYGKSSLMQEFGSQYQNGPVLLTDFAEVEEPAHVNRALLATISPFFCDLYPLTIYAGEI